MKAKYPFHRLLCTWLVTIQMIFLLFPIFTLKSKKKSSNTQRTLSIEECKADPARQWSSARNICTYKQQAVDDRKEYRACANLSDDSARKKCHENYAKKRTGELTDENIQGEGKAMMLAGVNVAFAAINMLTKGKGKSNCKSKQFIWRRLSSNSS